MAVKAKLKIQLTADSVVVAESDDEHLWRQVLAAIQGAAPLLDADEDRGTIEDGTGGGGGKGVAGLANELDVTTQQLVGACEPSTEAPYIHLDSKCWEAFKRNTPARGAAAVSATQLAGTFLCLWFEYGEISGRPNQAQAREVFTALGAVDKNPSRSVKNCVWLQSRGGGIQINPAEVSSAHAVAKAFVLKQRIGTSD